MANMQSKAGGIENQIADSLQHFLSRRANPLFSCSEDASDMYSIAHVIGFSITTAESAAMFHIDTSDRQKVSKLLETFHRDKLLSRKRPIGFRKSFDLHVLKFAAKILGEDSLIKLWQAAFCCDGLGACTFDFPDNPAYVDIKIAEKIRMLSGQLWDSSGRSLHAQLRFGKSGSLPLALFMLKGMRLDQLFSSEAYELLDSVAIDDLTSLANSSRWFLEEFDGMIVKIISTFID